MAEVEFNVQDIRDNIIFGIPLNDADGNPFPDSLLQSYLDSAIAWAEQTLHICITPREQVEEHDYLRSDHQNWGFIKLWKRPILEVKSLEMWYGERKMFDVPDDWLKIENLAGQIQLFPTSGSTGGMILNAQGGMALPILSGSLGYAPQMWRITYTAGLQKPEEKGIYRQNHLHPNLKEVIYKKAAMGIMGVWGDLIIGAGIANQSISLDGVSQSVGTTQSAMYGGASSRILQLKEDIESHMPALRAFYGGLDMVVI